MRRTSWQTSLAAILPLLLLLALPGWAQDTAAGSGERVRLNWDQAWRLAVENNEAHRLSKQEQEKARLQVLEAYSNAMPTLNFEGVFNHYFEIPSNPVTMPGELNFANPGQPFTTTFAFAQENVINANAQLTQPLWLAGKVGLGVRIAKNYKQISELGVKVSRQDLRVQLVEAFYGVLIAEDYVDVARDALTQAERHRDRVQSMFDEGMVSEYDQIRAGVAVSNLQPQVQSAENARDLAYKGLKNLLGMDLDTEIQLDGELDEVILKPLMQYETASDFAAGQRVELQQLDLQKKLYEDQRTIESRSWLWPNFLAGLRWETTAQSNEMDLWNNQFYNGASAQLILNIPLFDGLAAHRRSQIAEVNSRNVELQRAQLRRGIQLQVFQAMRQFELAGDRLEAALQNRRQAERGYGIAETRYAEGVGTQLEMMDARLQLTQARINVLQSKYDQLVARAQYDRALGVAWDPESGEIIEP